MQVRHSLVELRERGELPGTVLESQIAVCCLDADVCGQGGTTRNVLLQDGQCITY